MEDVPTNTSEVALSQKRVEKAQTRPPWTDLSISNSSDYSIIPPPWGFSPSREETEQFPRTPTFRFGHPQRSGGKSSFREETNPFRIPPMFGFESDVLADESSSSKMRQRQEKFNCDKCSKSYATKNDLERHQRVVHRKKVNCDKCSKSFITTNDLERHQKTVHGVVRKGERVWLCEIPGCGASSKVWTRLDNFKQHVIRMHGDVFAERAEEMYQMYDPDKHEKPPLAAKPTPRSFENSIATGGLTNFGNIYPTSDDLELDHRQRANSVHHRQTDVSDSDDDGNMSLRSDTFNHPHDQIGEKEPFFACPYYKAYPITYSSGSPCASKYAACGTLTMQSISVLKYHLKRKHKMPKFYCPICFTRFSGSNDRDQHLRDRSCDIRSGNPFEDMISEETFDAIERINSKADLKERWYYIFGTIFPRHMRPASPYQDDELGTWHNIMLKAFQKLDFRAQEFRDSISGPKAQPMPPPLNQIIIENAYSVFEARNRDNSMISLPTTENLDSTTADRSKANAAKLPRTYQTITTSADANAHVGNTYNYHTSHFGQTQLSNQRFELGVRLSAAQAIRVLERDRTSSTILEHIVNLPVDQREALIVLLEEARNGLGIRWLKEFIKSFRDKVVEDRQAQTSNLHDDSHATVLDNSRKRRATEPPADLSDSHPVNTASEPSILQAVSAETDKTPPPTEKPRRVYPDEVWETMRPRIVDLYSEQDLTLHRVMEKMREEHDFHATEKMYKMRFKRWGLSKYNRHSTVTTK